LAVADEDLVIPAPVMVEVDYWCRKLLDLETLDVLVEDIATGALPMVGAGGDGYPTGGRAREDLPRPGLGYVDAAVIATCELLDEDRLVTLDRRHMGKVRPGHRRFLRLLPD
jgi:hypothetical protein